jgi:hypothetical protein
VNGLSDSIAWPSRDPDSVGKVVLMGLITLIPVVGQMVLWGWMLTALDNLRVGRPVLPAASFSYLGRGVSLFVVYLVYGVVLTVILTAVILGGVSLLVGQRAAPVGLLLIVLGYGLLLLCALGLLLLSPLLILATDRGGIRAGLDLPAIVAAVRSDFNSALYAGLFALIALLIGSIGSIVCLIGQTFTVPYGYAVLAGVVHHYERTAGVPATSAPVA